jgi:thymidylate synthase (FAD)
MKIIEASFKVLEDFESIYKKIEYCGRTCYQSFDKITSDSYVKFIQMIMKNGHYSVLEHANIYIVCEESTYEQMTKLPTRNKRFFRYTDVNRYLISANVRAWIEALPIIEMYMPEVAEELKYQYSIFFGEPLKMSIDKEVVCIKEDDLYSIERKKHCRPTVKFIADRGFMAEIRTHRDASFSIESTRFCSYNTEKTDNQITVIKPLFLVDEVYEVWKHLNEKSEITYNHMTHLGSTPQEARSVLTMSLKTEIICTAHYEEWDHMFELRCATGAHPQMRELMIPLREQLI